MGILIYTVLHGSIVVAVLQCVDIYSTILNPYTCMYVMNCSLKYVWVLFVCTCVIAVQYLSNFESEPGTIFKDNCFS